MEPLTTDIITVLAVLVFAVFMFVVEWVSVDMVAIIVMVMLPILNILVGGNFITADEAISGFSSNAVISIIAVIILGGALEKTGIVNKLVTPLLKLAGKSPSRILMFVAGVVATLSSFMQNIAAAAMFLPAIKRASKIMNVPASQLLMPVGFAAIMGGTITLVGSSPLILLNDLLKPFNLKPFGMFDVTPIGIGIAVIGIGLFVVFGKYILPRRGGEQTGDDSAAILASYEDIKGPFELKITGGFTATTVRELRDEYHVRVVAILEPNGARNMAPPPDVTVGPNTQIAVYGYEPHVKAMAKSERLELKDALEVFTDDLSSSMAGVVEAVIAPRSELVGKTLAQVNFQQLYSVTPIALYRNGQILYSVLVEVPLQQGDAIVFQGSWERLQILQGYRDLVFSTPVTVEPLKPEKAFWSAFWFVLALSLVIFTDIRLSICVLIGMVGVVLTRVVSLDESYYKIMDWRTVFLLAGLIPLGIATEKSGAAEWIAKTIVHLIGEGGVSPIVLYSVVGLLATGFSLVISNVGATVLLVPLAIAMAKEAGADPRMAALIIGIGTSNSFILPTHQVNALYMGPGKYRSIDYIKAGSILSAVFLVVLIAMIYILSTYTSFFN
jgi:di/tricarboxylate transporter